MHPFVYDASQATTKLPNMNHVIQDTNMNIGTRIDQVYHEIEVMTAEEPITRRLF